MKIQTDYLKGIVDNNFSILQMIYKESLPEVSKYIQKNSGTLDDAKDIFQEGILVIYHKAKQNSLQLTSSFHAYLFSICKNLWLKKLRSKKNQIIPLFNAEDSKIETEYEEQFLTSRKWKLFNVKFQALADECRKVLQMLFNGNSGKEIALHMGYTEEYAKRKKYKCKQHLAQLIKNDPEFKSLSPKAWS
jgi:RNA polymerase sigma factor (sigma-70 family)